MARPLLAFFFVTIVVVGASGAGLAPESYWLTVLPDTPIPGALRQLLPSGFPRSQALEYYRGSGSLPVPNSLCADEKAAMDSSLLGVGVTVGSAGVVVTVGTPGRGVNVNVNPFRYQYAASKTQIHDNADIALFFLEKDLAKGHEMKLHFRKTVPRVPFWPRSVAESLPFSSAKLPDILCRLSLKPSSEKAAIITKTLHSCEEPGVKGETRHCATSLESMVDFATSSLGSPDLLALCTEVSKPNSPKQAYTIAPPGVKKMVGGQAVACHAQPYAYAVYYCHTAPATKSYLVSLAGKDGTQVKAAAVCHSDTSSWNPKHIAFQLLKVSPGTVSICHFLPEDHVIWTRRV